MRRCPLTLGHGGALARSSLAACALLAALACERRKSDEPPPPPPPPPSSAELAVPPAASFNATPVASVGATSELDGKSPVEQARAYAASGEFWKARLLLEPTALGSGATADETELLASICAEQRDETCLAACAAKLGRRPHATIAAAAPGQDGGRAEAPTHAEPDTELARARDRLIAGDLAGARKMLEPRVIEGTATREETRLLKVTCEKQGDRMCAALCNARLH